MGEIGEFTPKLQEFLGTYRWRVIDPVPWTPLARPLSEATVALVSTAGFVMPGQEPFDGKARGGDSTYRLIPGDADPATLVDTHRSESFDHTAIRRDPNLAFPLDRIREMESAGRIGAVARRHLSFMGAITAPGRLIRDTAPEAARALVDDGVEAAILVPV